MATKQGRRVLSADAIANALRKAGGSVTEAARVLGTARSTVTRRLAASEPLRALRDEVREETLDLAESTLLKKIRAGNLGAVIFYLKTQGRSRGYVERAELSGVEGVAPIRFYIPKKAPLPDDDEPLETMSTAPIDAVPTERKDFDA